MKAWAITVTLLAVVLATQAYPAWHTQISAGYATDVQSYVAVARAAPELPHARLPEQHAQRWAPNWVAGAAADLTRLPLRVVFRVLTLACLLAMLLLLQRLLRAQRLAPPAFAIGLGLVVASAYPFRYELAAPGMLADAAFLAAFALLLLAFAEDRPWLAVAALCLATPARQTAVPVAVATALLLARRRPAAAAAGLATSVATYLVVRAVAAPFSRGTLGSIGDTSVLGTLGHPHALVAHVGRTLLPLLVPVALLAAASIRARARPPAAPLVLALAVVLQPLLLSPAWVVRNEPRLAGLAIPAFVAAAAPVLRELRLGLVSAAVVLSAELAASLHARYSHVGVPGNTVWAALVVGSALATLAAVATGTRPGRTAATAVTR